MKTRFLEVNPYGEDMARMQGFAKSFNHEIVPSRGTKVFAFERDNKIFGYADIMYLPVAFPAFHPELTSPRSVIEVVDAWRTHCELSFGGQGVIGVPLDQERKTFPKKMIESRGYRKMKRELYELT